MVWIAAFAMRLVRTDRLRDGAQFRRKRTCKRGSLASLARQWARAAVARRLAPAETGWARVPGVGPGRVGLRRLAGVALVQLTRMRRTDRRLRLRKPQRVTANCV